MKILMVCLGNICRSPLAEGIMANKVKENGLNYEVDSAGTAAYHIGNLPDERSIEVANKYGIDLTTQRARQFKVNDFQNFDIIYAMDTENYNNILNLANSEEDELKVKLILNEIEPNSNSSVPDPYYGGDEGFDNVYQMLNLACESIITKLK
ncbi:low molecular weight phosphotyrosine protein phosphatase [Flavobacteriales bacterium]|nr:low molecular weight phosphotyrosine protein phosphatase [Flavobacteriales bacterium]